MIPMANNAHRMRALRATRQEIHPPPTGSDGIRQLLPWWSKLTHQLLLAENVLVRNESEEGDEREDRCIAPGTPCVRVRETVDDGSGVRARRID
jgi:hypothetical protein